MVIFGYVVAIYSEFLFLASSADFVVDGSLAAIKHVLWRKPFPEHDVLKSLLDT